MKKLLFVLSILFIFGACEEESPYINFLPDRTIDDTTYVKLPAPTAQAKNALIEEFSGVKCANCPAAQAAAKGISDANPGRVNIVTVHPLNIFSALTRPFDKNGGDEFNSAYDFRTNAGAKIFEMVGLSIGLPIGNIDRKQFAGESARNIDYTKWSAYVGQQLAQTTPVNIDLSARNTGDSVEITFTGTYTSSVSDSQYVSIAILESELEDIQESRDQNGNSIFIENYIHKHVLRTFVTGFFGDYLNASYVPGRVFYKKYRIKRDPKWNAAHLDVLAFVHLNTTKKDVIQSKEVKVN